MKTRGYLLASVLAVALGTTVAVAQVGGGGAGGGAAGGAGGGGGRGAGGAGGGFGGRGGGFMGAQATANPYAEMVKTLTTLTDDQKTQLKTKTDAMQQALADQQTDQRDKMQTARQAMTGNDPDARAAFQATMQKLQDDRQALIDKSEMDVEAVLTPDQRVEWEGHKLNKAVEARFAAAKLTDDQKAKVDAAVKETAKLLAAVTDAKEKPPIIGKFWKKLVAEILTDDQLARLLAPPQTPGGALGALAGMFGGGMGGGGMGGGGMGGGGMGGGGGGMGGGGGGRGGMGGGGGGGGRGGRGGGGRGGMGGGGGGAGGGGGGGPTN